MPNNRMTLNHETQPDGESVVAVRSGAEGVSRRPPLEVR